MEACSVVVTSGSDVVTGARADLGEEKGAGARADLGEGVGAGARADLARLRCGGKCAC